MPPVLDSRTHRWLLRLQEDGKIERAKWAERWDDALRYHRQLEREGLIAIAQEEDLFGPADRLDITLTEIGREAIARYERETRDPEQSFPDPDTMAETMARIDPLLRLGGSTWTYPGWTGVVYRRTYPKSGAGAKMLREYAEWPLFRTVGIDSFYYQPPSETTLRKYAEALPYDFRCAVKAWREVTAHTFTSPEDGERRGERNPDWLNADLFHAAVLAPLQEHFAAHLGPIIFELEAIPEAVRMTPDALGEALTRFFTALPRGPMYAVELRNSELLTPEHLATLRRLGVAHLFNSWTRMPALSAQRDLPGAMTADFLIVRAMLRPGRTYADAVKAFAPYDRIREPNPELRAGVLALAGDALARRIPAYLLISNRAEGSSPLTAWAIARLLAGSTGCVSDGNTPVRDG